MTDPSPPSPSSAVSAAGGSGLPENLAGALAYLLGPITGILFFIVDRPRAFVRFHAVQSIAVTIAWVAVWVAMTILGVVLSVIPILGWLVNFLLILALSLAGFALWIWLMLQAYQGRSWEVPLLGPHVRRITTESGAGNQGPVT